MDRTPPFLSSIGSEVGLRAKGQKSGDKDDMHVWLFFVLGIRQFISSSMDSKGLTNEHVLIMKHGRS